MDDSFDNCDNYVSYKGLCFAGLCIVNAMVQVEWVIVCFDRLGLRSVCYVTR